MQVKQAANVVEFSSSLARHGEPATLAEIADKLDWPRSSTFNLVGTLVDKGYFYEPTQRGGYFPVPMADGPAGHRREGPASGSTAGTGRRDFRADRRDNRARLRLGSFGGLPLCARIASADPLFCRSGNPGSDPCEFRRAGNPVADEAEGTRTDLPEADLRKYSDDDAMEIEQIEQELRASTERGYHQSNSEFIADLAGVSFPIGLEAKRLSIVVAGPVSRCLARRADIANHGRRDTQIGLCRALAFMKNHGVMVAGPTIANWARMIGPVLEKSGSRRICGRYAP